MKIDYKLSIPILNQDQIFSMEAFNLLSCAHVTPFLSLFSFTKPSPRPFSLIKSIYFQLKLDLQAQHKHRLILALLKISRGVVAFLKLVGPNYNGSFCYQKNGWAHIGFYL